MSNVTCDEVIEISESGPDDRPESAGPVFTVGAVLNRTWTVLFKNPTVFFGLTILVLALVRFVIDGMVMLWPEVVVKYYMFIALILGMILDQWIGGAVAYGVYQSLRGNRASLANSLFHGTRRIVPLLFVGTLVGLGTALGSLLFVIPGIILHCMWVAAIPVCVVERLSATDSLFRSEKLTRDCRMKIFGLLLTAEVITRIFTRTASLLMGAEDTTALPFIINIAVNLLPIAFTYVMIAVIYYSLRESKEGVGIEQLANVFD